MLKTDEEGDDCLATLRLNDVKMSKKDNKIIVTDKGKGVMGYLLHNNTVLGFLVFNSLNNFKKR